MDQSQKYRTNLESAFVDAIQWTGKNARPVYEFITGKGHCLHTSHNVVLFQNFEEQVGPYGIAFGEHSNVMPGNWIVRDVSGRLNVFIDADFRETYTPATAAIS